jgi:DNA-binding GntR family transcriptional regulator
VEQTRGREVRPADIFAPAAATLLTEEVVELLRDAILKGRFRPGDRLREEHLGEALGVSRGPVRSALQQLEREELVVRRRNRGAIVAELATIDVEEVYSLRLAIEPLACAWAARNAVEQDLEEMQAIIDGYSTTLTTRVGDREAADEDLRFHDAIYRAARHKRLMRLWQDLRPQVFVFLLARTYVRSRKFREMMITGHGTILDAIARGDEEAAREAAAEHVETSYANVLASYSKQSDE